MIYIALWNIYLFYGYDINDNWEEIGMINEEVTVVEYGQIDQTDIVYENTSSYHIFLGNFTSSEFRRLYLDVYRDEDEEIDSEISSSDFSLSGQSIALLSTHCSTMVDKRTL